MIDRDVKLSNVSIVHGFMKEVPRIKLYIYIYLKIIYHYYLEEETSE